jgi:hypothetical protein
MRSVSQLVDLIYRQTPRQQRHNIVFVIGSWVGLTVDDQRRWPSKLTDVDQELLRYGLFQKGNNELVHSWLPDSYLSNAFEAVWPFMLPYALYAEMGRDLLSREKITFIPPGVILPWHQPEKMLNEATRTDSQIAADLKSYVGYVGPASEWTGGGFADLQKTAAQISREDGHLIFIDLPIPSQSRSLEICTIYEQKIKSTLASFQSDPHIEYVDMQEACNDDEFFDSVHARPKVTMKIAQKAALPINRALNKLLAQKDGE